MAIIPTIILPTVIEDNMREAILTPLLQFNEQRSGQADIFDPLAVLLPDPDTGEITGCRAAMKVRQQRQSR